MRECIGGSFFSSRALPAAEDSDIMEIGRKAAQDKAFRSLTQLREQLVQPATEEALGAEILISDYTATAAVFEDYTASRGVSALTAYYDGDICAFAETEKLLLMDYNAVMRESADEDENGTAFKAQAEALRQKLQPFFSGSENRMHRVMADTVRPNTGVYGRLTDGALYCFAQAKGEE
jgi:hypothetical protein